MIPETWFIDASKRIAPHIQKTPLTFDHDLNIYIKRENHQTTGSFKLRGALNKILCLQDWERERGIVTASAGNHGQGVAMAASLVNASVTVFASEHAAPIKLEAMRSKGAKIILISGGYGEAEKAGIKYAQENQSTWISPYNDGKVIAGAGTLALEILNELPESSTMTWIVPVGGGGLISGIGAILKEFHTQQNNQETHLDLKPKLIGVQPKASAFLHAIFKHGHQTGVEDLPTLADGLSGPVEDRSITIPMVQKYVDDIITVREDEIEQAITFAWKTYGEIIEGSAAVALAAILNHSINDRPAVVILSGGNIQKETFTRIVGSTK